MRAVTQRMAKRSVVLLSLALIAFALAGSALTACGQKGQLYLPSQKKSKVPPAQQPPTTPPPGPAAPS